MNDEVKKQSTIWLSLADQVRRYFLMIGMIVIELSFLAAGLKLIWPDEVVAGWTDFLQILGVGTLFFYAGYVFSEDQSDLRTTLLKGIGLVYIAPTVVLVVMNALGRFP